MSIPLLTLFLAAFAFGTAEFVIAGVLPEVANGLGVTIPVAGYLVTGYAIGIAAGGPLLAVATKKLSRKVLILLLCGTFAIGQALCAIAPNFETLLPARVLVSVMHGTYFGVAAIVAVGLVGKDKRGFAVAMILAGLTVSNILGVPGGTAIGNAFGWRATFWAVGALTLVATIAIALFLPSHAGQASTGGSFRREFKALGRQQIISCLIIAILAMIAQYSVFTYIAPLLLEVTELSADVVPWILLLYGVGATIGVFIGGRLSDWRQMPSVIGILAAQLVTFILMYVVAPHAIVMAVMVIIWGGVNFAIGAPLQARILGWAGNSPNLASSLIPTGYNIGIAIGAVIGASLLDSGFGYRGLPLIGVVTLTMALLVAIWSGLREQRSGETPPLASANA